MTTDKRTYTYEFEGHVIKVTRHHDRTAYARNGNVHNPTLYFRWASTLDGQYVITSARTRRDALECAKEEAGAR